MSRGPGVQQRRLLDALATVDRDGGVYVTDTEATGSENVSARRAAYKLEQTGQIKLVVHDRRLVAVHPDSEFECGVIHGIDGKRYRVER